MKIYTLWHAGYDGGIPWIVAAVDEHTVDINGEFPPEYLKNRAIAEVRELILHVPQVAVRRLFEALTVKATVIESKQG